MSSSSSSVLNTTSNYYVVCPFGGIVCCQCHIPILRNSTNRKKSFIQGIREHEDTNHPEILRTITQQYSSSELQQQHLNPTKVRRKEYLIQRRRQYLRCSNQLQDIAIGYAQIRNSTDIIKRMYLSKYLDNVSYQYEYCIDCDSMIYNTRTDTIHKKQHHNVIQRYGNATKVWKRRTPLVLPIDYNVNDMKYFSSIFWDHYITAPTTIAITDVVTTADRVGSGSSTNITDVNCSSTVSGNFLVQEVQQQAKNLNDIDIIETALNVDTNDDRDVPDCVGSGNSSGSGSKGSTTKRTSPSSTTLLRTKKSMMGCNDDDGDDDNDDDPNNTLFINSSGSGNRNYQYKTDTTSNEDDDNHDKYNENGNDTTDYVDTTTGSTNSTNSSSTTTATNRLLIYQQQDTQEKNNSNDDDDDKVDSVDGKDNVIEYNDNNNSNADIGDEDDNLGVFGGTKKATTTTTTAGPIMITNRPKQKYINKDDTKKMNQSIVINNDNNNNCNNRGHCAHVKSILHQMQQLYPKKTNCVGGITSSSSSSSKVTTLGLPVQQHDEQPAINDNDNDDDDDDTSDNDSETVDLNPNSLDDIVGDDNDDDDVVDDNDDDDDDDDTSDNDGETVDVNPNSSDDIVGDDHEDDDDDTSDNDSETVDINPISSDDIVGDDNEDDVDDDDVASYATQLEPLTRNSTIDVIRNVVSPDDDGSTKLDQNVIQPTNDSKKDHLSILSVNNDVATSPMRTQQTEQVLAENEEKVKNTNSNVVLANEDIEITVIRKIVDQNVTYNVKWEPKMKFVDMISFTTTNTSVTVRYQKACPIRTTTTITVAFKDDNNIDCNTSTNDTPTKSNPCNVVGEDAMIKGSSNSNPSMNHMYDGDTSSIIDNEKKNTGSCIRAESRSMLAATSSSLSSDYVTTNAITENYQLQVEGRPPRKRLRIHLRLK